MNGFVIAVGGYVAPLTDRPERPAAKIGAVEVDMGDTACKVPYVAEYIEKIEARRLGEESKSAAC